MLSPFFIPDDSLSEESVGCVMKKSWVRVVLHE